MFVVTVLTIVLMGLAASLGLGSAFSQFVGWPSSDVLLAATGRGVRAVAGVLGYPLR